MVPWPRPIEQRHQRRRLVRGTVSVMALLVIFSFSIDSRAFAASELATPIISQVTPTSTSVNVTFDVVSGASSYVATVERSGRVVASNASNCLPTACSIPGLAVDVLYGVTVTAKGDGTVFSDSPPSALVHFRTTTVVVAPAIAGWRVLVRSGRGVVVDERTFDVDGATFSAVRFRAGTVAFHLHVGSSDPPGAESVVPSDASDRVSPQELALGVVGVFNSGFQASDDAGGSMIDGHVFGSFDSGRATVAVTTSGQLVMGVWGGRLPSARVNAIEYRQNLVPLVMNRRVTSAAASPYWGEWGATWESNPRNPRSALGIDQAGDVLYVATTQGVMPIDVARALVAAGAVTGMELDINPYWPCLGVTASAHTRNARFVYTLPGQLKNPSTYFTSSTRDFFVAVAEPPSTSCNIMSPPRRAAPRDEPLTVSGSGCTSS